MKHVDVVRHVVVLDEEEIPYDVLVVASGSSHHYFGHPEWEALAPSLKTVEDATEIRRRVLLAFEAAEREPDEIKRTKWLTFVVVGGGPTGVELAGAIAELAHVTAQGQLSPDSTRASQDCAGRGRRPCIAHVRNQAIAASLEIAPGVRRFTAHRCHGDGRAARIGHGSARHNRRANRHAHGHVGGRGGRVAIGADSGRGAAPRPDRVGRLVVGPDLTLPGHGEIFVIGDLANCSHQTGTPLPGLAPVAMQQGRYVARVLRTRRAGRAVVPFCYRDRGMIATIGRAKAVADICGFQFAGFFAWMIWLLVHLMYLVQFQNRILVLIQWAWSYTTRNSPARLITSKAFSPGAQEGGSRTTEELKAQRPLAPD